MFNTAQPDESLAKLHDAMLHALHYMCVVSRDICPRDGIAAARRTPQTCVATRGNHAAFSLQGMHRGPLRLSY